jgi:aromatic-L-amino-acid/L-tryptophan decarboxylase
MGAAADGEHGDLPTETLRQHGYRAVDWVADYLDRVGELPVLAEVQPGEIRTEVGTGPPGRAEDLGAILDDLERVVMPGITHWQHPRFLAYFAITGSVPGILGELIAAGLNVNGMLWRTSPAATEVELATMDWLRQMLGLPAGFDGIIMDTASMSTLVALATARHRRWPGVRNQGYRALGGLQAVLYTSAEAHSSVRKAALTLGLGIDAVRSVPVDDRFRMDVAALEEAVAADRSAGHEPFAVVATVGTTSTTSIDPVPTIADICERERLWLHVDGAYGGTAAIVPELRHVLEGVDRADSLVVNPHKWLATPIDCSAFYVRDTEEVKRAFSLVPEYLRTDDEGVENLMDRGPQLGRRFRALKLWMVIRAFGADGLAARIREHVRLAGIVAAWVDECDGFERTAPTPLSTVCLRAVFDGADEEETDRRNADLLEAVNASGRAYLSHTVLDGRYSLRIAVGNLRTTEDDIREVLDLLQREAARLR